MKRLATLTPAVRASLRRVAPALAVMMTALIASCEDAPPTAPEASDLETVLAAPSTGLQGRIAYASARGGSFDIYVADLATGRARRLTRTKATDTDPAWSPDGQKIAFMSRRDGSDAIYVMPATGGTATRITFERSSQPAWSPDGTKLVVTSDRFGSSGNSSDIYAINADGTGTGTNITNNAATDWEPAWSPDGSKIAFSSNRDNSSFDIYLVNADGTGSVTRLTTGGGRYPAWSPDGAKLAFTDASFGIDVMSVSAAGAPGSPTRVASGLHPTWSPDGSRIAYFYAGAGGHDIYAVKLADGSVSTVVGSSGVDQAPAWAP